MEDEFRIPLVPRAFAHKNLLGSKPFETLSRRGYYHRVGRDLFAGNNIDQIRFEKHRLAVDFQVKELETLHQHLDKPLGIGIHFEHCHPRVLRLPVSWKPIVVQQSRSEGSSGSSSQAASKHPPPVQSPSRPHVQPDLSSSLQSPKNSTAVTTANPGLAAFGVFRQRFNYNQSNAVHERRPRCSGCNLENAVHAMFAELHWLRAVALPRSHRSRCVHCLNVSPRQLAASVSEVNRAPEIRGFRYRLCSKILTCGSQPHSSTPEHDPGLRQSTQVSETNGECASSRTTN